MARSRLAGRAAMVWFAWNGLLRVSFDHFDWLAGNCGANVIFKSFRSITSAGDGKILFAPVGTIRIINCWIVGFNIPIAGS